MEAKEAEEVEEAVEVKEAVETAGTGRGFRKNPQDRDRGH